MAGKLVKAVESSRGEDMMCDEGYSVQMGGVRIACGLDVGRRLGQ